MRYQHESSHDHAYKVKQTLRMDSCSKSLAVTDMLALQIACHLDGLQWVQTRHSHLILVAAAASISGYDGLAVSCRGVL